MILCVDRIEGGIAVCEAPNGERLNLSLSILPDEIREGSVLRKTNGGFVLDKEEEERRRKEALELQKQLFKDE